jgi:hypothetical protein
MNPEPITTSIKLEQGLKLEVTTHISNHESAIARALYWGNKLALAMLEGHERAKAAAR